ncbi:(2Fe-2S)-binding protein [Kitasatospora sp. GP82]|uniref:(2Fe-2S)-binding protein n=1 Tax=Kitasatospora sp. GP82 TaxID=3035089 RepID=UPI0024760B08|nr:(2Fe-2S)-binding protein [Kitasatospora sp. GP82]MDH6125407.1 ferric iron reductase protein FhuF [Kitasatospora sp. GP82]
MRSGSCSASRTAADAAGTARLLAEDLPARDPLRGTGTVSHRRASFRRSTCCPYYRVPGSGLCGDCVLPTAPGRRR